MKLSICFLSKYMKQKKQQKIEKNPDGALEKCVQK